MNKCLVSLAVAGTLAACITSYANSPAYNLDTPVFGANLDQETFQAWDPGAEPHLYSVGNVREAIWSKESGQPSWCGITFSGSRELGERHLRIGFLEPVAIGSILVRGDVRVGYGDVYEVVKVAKDCNVKHLGLVSVEK